MPIQCVRALGLWGSGAAVLVPWAWRGVAERPAGSLWRGLVRPIGRDVSPGESSRTANSNHEIQGGSEPWRWVAASRMAVSEVPEEMRWCS